MHTFQTGADVVATQWWFRADRWRPWVILVLLSVIPLVLFLYAADRMLRNYETRNVTQASLTAADSAGRSLQEHFIRAETFLTTFAAQPELLTAWQRHDL